MAKPDDKDEALKRLGGGRWQTRDERFTIEPQSGTWVVVDAEQTDDLGLALVRGPFGSLRAAKAAIDAARASEPAPSPLTARSRELQKRPPTARPPKARAEVPGGRATTSAQATTATKSGRSADPREPRWVTDLDPDERRSARRLIDRLAEAGAPDPEGIARRDLVGDVPAAAAFAVARAIVELGTDAAPASVARLVAEGRDERLGVRWRLVDGDGRPIVVDLDGGGRR